MTNKKLTYFTIIIFLANILLTSCESDDNLQESQEMPVFSESDLSTIHGDSEKSWHITEVINIYYDPSDPLEIDIDCLRDDVYTFHKDDLSFSVDLGENKCFGQNNDGIFVADEEIFDGELIYMNASQGETIYMRYSIGFMNSQGTFTWADGKQKSGTWKNGKLQE